MTTKTVKEYPFSQSDTASETLYDWPLVSAVVRCPQDLVPRPAYRVIDMSQLSIGVLGKGAPNKVEIYNFHKSR